MILDGLNGWVQLQIPILGNLGEIRGWKKVIPDALSSVNRFSLF
jgi:hypothetical protein